MQRTVKKQTSENRILLFNNFQKREEIERRLRNAISIANNTVIPICLALELPVLKPLVLQWVGDEDAFREYFITKCTNEAKGSNSYLKSVIEKAAEEDFNTQLGFHPYPVYRGNTFLSEDEAGLIVINRNTMTYNTEKLTEYTNIYLTEPKLIEVYHKAEDLCKHLDAFFEGNIPSNDAVSSWANIVYPTPGGFKVNCRADFRKYIKK